MHDADKALYVEAQRDDGSWVHRSYLSEVTVSTAAPLSFPQCGAACPARPNLQVGRQRSLGPQSPVGRTVVDNNQLALVDKAYPFRPLARMSAACLCKALCRLEIETKFQMPDTQLDLLVLR